MKKRKIIITLVLTIVVLFGAIFFYANESAAATESQLTTFIEESIEAGLVVVSNERVYNLNVLQDFYNQTRWGIDDTITIIIDPYTRTMRTYEINFIDGRFLLYSEIDNNRDHHYTASEYMRLFRIFRDNEIRFLLECSGNNERLLFGYSTN